MRFHNKSYYQFYYADHYNNFIRMLGYLVIEGVILIMVNTRDVLCRMKVSELNNIIRIFELKAGCRKKENIIDIIYEYMKNNMSYIFREYIIYDELNLLKRICDNNFEMIREEEDVHYQYVKSLSCIGLVYIDKEKSGVFIPEEFQMQIKSCLDNKCVIEFSKNRSDIIRMTENLLEFYGVFHLELLEDYIMERIGLGYRVHRAIEFIRKYNIRNNFYYEDDDCFYYNLKINDRTYMKMRTIEMNLKYKHYKESEIISIMNRKCSYENDIRLILNRVYKNCKVSDEIIKSIKFMVIEGRTTNEIGCFIKEKVKRLSDFGFKSIVRSIGKMRNSYIIWGFKGYYLEEINEEMMA